MKFEEINDYDSLYFPEYNEWVVIMSKDEDTQTVDVMLNICSADNYKCLYNINPNRLCKKEKMEEKYFVIELGTYDCVTFTLEEESKMLEHIEKLSDENDLDIADDLIVIQGKRILLENKITIKSE